MTQQSVFVLGSVTVVINVSSWSRSTSTRQAKRLLSEIVEQCRYGPGFHCEMDGNGAIQQILIPANKVGLVIGKGGETIKQLQVW